MDDGGSFIVVWDSERQEYTVSGLGVFGRRFDSAGNPVGVKFQVNTYTPGNQYEPRVAADDDGDFVVVWWSFGQDGNQRGIFGRRFDSAGTPLASEFLANTYTSGFQYRPDVAMNADGDFTVAWEAFGHDGNSYGVFGRRHVVLTLVPADIDGDGSTDPLTDGLLILRYLFNFTGNALINGAVDIAGCMRCDATTITQYLDGLV
jgi:hypothetical protein